MKRHITFVLTVLASLWVRADGLQPVSFDAQLMQGSLDMRLRLNMQRLGEEKYQPDHVFLTMAQSGDWPGDTEGRTILGLTLDAQALHSASPNLEEILRRLPSHLNERGYMGPVFPDIIHEQQMSGNGWMLRGLCEYFEWRGDSAVLSIIRTMARNLFLPWKGYYATYPVRPEDRKQGVGAASGETVGQIGRWQLSSDVGCLFIGMDGLIHAYAVTRDEELRPIVEEMINVFLGIDLLAIKAQTHATLTALRGLLRYAAITGDRRMVDEAAARFRLYTEYGMTENFANYNWFRRYDTWTEPCAIVDSYLVAVQLWQQTRDVAYLEWAEQIYFNALCHGQRRNGGFGTDTCPGKGSGSAHLKVSIPEAHWCCTMRGAEGLANAARYSMFQSGDTLFFPFYRPATFKAAVGKHRVEISEQTKYPFDGTVQLALYMPKACHLTLCFPRYSWMQDMELTLNGKPVKAVEQEGFLVLSHLFRQVDHVALSFRLRDRELPLLNAENALPGHSRRIQHGPLVMGRRAGSDVLEPVWHLMDASVWEPDDDGLRILFPVSE